MSIIDVTVGAAVLALLMFAGWEAAEALGAEWRARRALWRERPGDALTAAWHADGPNRDDRRHAVRVAEHKATAVPPPASPEAKSPGLLAVTVLLAVLWAVVFVLQGDLDYAILRGLHDNAALAAGLGVVVAAAVTGTALRLTLLLRGGVGTNRGRRAGLVLGGAFLVVLVGTLVAVALARSEREYATQLRRTEKTAQVARESGDALAGSVADTDLTDLRKRLAGAQEVDRAWALFVPVTEALLSPFAVSAAGLALVANSKRADGKRRRRVVDAQAAEQRHLDRWIGRMVRRLTRAGHSPRRLDEFFAALRSEDRPAALPAGNPPAQDRPAPPDEPEVEPELPRPGPEAWDEP